LRIARENGFEIAIIDTPPAAGPQAYTAAEHADLILIPCRPSLIDLDAIKRTAQLVKSVNKPAFVVFNAAPPSATTLLEHARAIVSAENIGLAVAPVIIRERSAFRAAWPLGQGVVEYQPKGKAAQEISALKKWAFEQVGLCTPAHVKKVKAAHG